MILFLKDIGANRNVFQEYGWKNVGTLFKGNILSYAIEFLKEDKKIEQIIDNSFWSLYRNNQKLSPLMFSNGKTQEDVVKEVVDSIKEGIILFP